MAAHRILSTCILKITSFVVGSGWANRLRCGFAGAIPAVEGIAVEDAGLPTAALITHRQDSISQKFPRLSVKRGAGKVSPTLLDGKESDSIQDFECAVSTRSIQIGAEMQSATTSASSSSRRRNSFSVHP